MRRPAVIPALLSLAFMLMGSNARAATSRLDINARADQRAVTLVGPEDRQQLAITLRDEAGGDRDATRDAKYTASPSGVVTVSKSGFVTPLANGEATIKVEYDGAAASIPARVRSFEHPQPLSFPNDIVPLFTRAGCNGGACHGKPAGQNGFKLSLLGFEPRSDYEFLTQESRGRRISPAAPEQSLFLRKGFGDMGHAGGVRLEKGFEYDLIKRWIAEGLPYGPKDDPVVERVEVFPKVRVVARGASQQLVVTAFFSDGTQRDVTRAVEFRANQTSMAEVDHHGLATFKDLPGTTSIMVRFQERVDAFMATIPLGAPTPSFPTPANFVDERIFEKLRTLGLPVSELCDDSTFLRRVTLDLTGRLPTIEETKAFLDSTAANKRAQKIDELLDSAGYADLFAGKWAGILRNKAGGNLEQVARETYAFHGWIREGLLRNKPFDQFATELITARGAAGRNPAVSWYRAVKETNERMADIAQVFLGVRVHCAQCHHHPYEKWSQDDYYGMAAFFSTVGRKEVRKMPENDSLYHLRKVALAKNPNTNKELRPTPLDGSPIEIPAERDPRINLAEWMTSPDNPWFSKMLVNRYWKHFFGRGFVEPEDDIRVTNPPTHPELIEKLASRFQETGYDLKALCRVICNSRTYQLSSIPNEHNKADEQNFSRYQPRRLSAEVMLDAINDVAGAKNSFNKQPAGIRAVALPDDNANRESFFLRVFGRPQMDTACECERTASANLGQSLHLINSDDIHRILGTGNGRAAGLAKDTKRSDEARITEVYLSALSRKPVEKELKIARAHLEKKRAQAAADPEKLKPEQAEKEAFEDIIWVVTNTKEFLFNH